MTPHKDNKQHDKQLEALLKAAMAGYDDPAPEDGQQSKTANGNAGTSGGADAKGDAGTSGGASSTSKDRDNSKGHDSKSHDSNAQKPADSKKEKDGNKSVLSGVPDALPSLIKAYRIQDKARNVGFDWEDKGDVWAKVREELGELEEELRRDDKERSKEELGDFLFSVINAARLYHINPDTALEITNNKFIRRFNYIEQHSIKVGKPLTEMTLEEMDKLWLEAKKNE